jgi:hypothetical protein
VKECVGVGPGSVDEDKCELNSVEGGEDFDEESSSVAAAATGLARRYG